MAVLSPHLVSVSQPTCRRYFHATPSIATPDSLGYFATCSAILHEACGMMPSPDAALAAASILSTFAAVNHREEFRSSFLRW